MRNMLCGYDARKKYEQHEMKTQHISKIQNGNEYKSTFIIGKASINMKEDFTLLFKTLVRRSFWIKLKFAQLAACPFLSLHLIPAATAIAII
jgi:hypothetical protein